MVSPQTKIAVFIGLCALWAVASSAEQWGPEGTYAIDGAASDNIETAITHGTAEMNFAIRSIARSRIAKTNPLYGTIHLHRSDIAVTVQFDTGKPIELPLDGRAIPWERQDGGTYDVSAECSTTELVMRFHANDGERTNTFVLEPDGTTLKLHVKLESPRLPAPIRYTLSYRRSSR